MRVAIVGAGVAGLAAGRTLAKAGIPVVLFEKSRGPGGRLATRKVDDFTFDTGATSIAPRGLGIQAAMLQELDTSELIEIKSPIYTHVNLRAHPGDAARNAIPRYSYRSGNNHLAKLLANGLEIRLNTTVDRLERQNGAYEVEGERFDKVILTPPIPQASLLLWSLGESRPVANARYRSCLSIMLGFNQPNPNVPYHALIDVEQRHPLTWVSMESIKSQARAPDGQCAIVLQMSPAYSQDHYQTDDARVLKDVLPWVSQLFGSEYREPIAVDTKRWKYSQPEITAVFESVNRNHRGVVLAGDGLSAGRVERAYESGIEAARLILEEKP
ncbi:MAG: FAD-dependent oxidoreductase [Chlorobia bacterium]|nr:FAD-dependent oxidoreductase [Fimbriimonadaceae bacterium]